jgi:transposase
MLFPDQSPYALMAMLVAVCAVALISAGRDLLRAHSNAPTCPKCHLLFDAKRWAHHNRRTHINGRYTITPVYTCPRCGETVQATDK